MWLRKDYVLLLYLIKYVFFEVYIIPRDITMNSAVKVYVDTYAVYFDQLADDKLFYVVGILNSEV